MDIAEFKKRRQEREANSPVKKKTGFEKLTRFKMANHGFYSNYVCPPSTEMWAVFKSWFLSMLRHQNIGPEKKFAACLSKANVLIWSEPVQRAIAARNEQVTKSGHPEWVLELDPEQGCPVCEELEGGTATEDEKEAMQLQEELIAAVIPWYTKDLQGSNRRDIPDTQKTIEVWSMKDHQEKKLSEFMESQEVDFTDPRGAILWVIKKFTKKGGKANNAWDNRYEVDVDMASTMNRVKLSPPVRALLRKLEAGEALDMMAFVASQLRDYDTVAGYLTGVEIQKADPSQDPDGPPACFKTDIIDGEDETCIACPFKVECAAATGVAVPGEEEKPAAKVAAKPAPTNSSKPAPQQRKPDPEPEPEVEEEPEEVVEEPEPPPVKVATRPATTPAPRPGVQTKAQPAARPQPAAKPAPAVEAEPEEEEDPFEAELREAMGGGE